MAIKDNKISIIGAGNVGGLSAMRIAEAGLGCVLLIDVVKNLALAKVEDIKDAVSLLNNGSFVEASDDLTSLGDSEIVVVTAGSARKPGMEREDLLRINAKTIKEIASYIKKYAPNAIVVVVTNPVDIMTYLMLRETSFDKKKILGMGSSLDSARFSTQIQEKLNLNPKYIETLVIGAHSDSMLPLVRFSKIKNELLRTLFSEEDLSSIIYNTKHRGKMIVELYGSGSAYLAPSLAIFNIIEAIIKDKKSVIPISCLLEGEYEIKDLCIGVPANIGKNGISEIIELKLNKEEKEAFFESANKIREGISLLENII